MKECPVCHAVMEEEERCPVCGQFILYEPPSGAHKESLARNGCTYRYLARKLWLPVLSLIAVIVIMAVRWPLEPLIKQIAHTVDGHTFYSTVRNTSEQYLWLSLLLAVLSLIISVFERAAARWLEWKYSREYARIQAAAAKYILGGTALLTALLIASIE